MLLGDESIMAVNRIIEIVKSVALVGVVARRSTCVAIKNAFQLRMDLETPKAFDAYLCILFPNSSLW